MMVRVIAISVAVMLLSGDIVSGQRAGSGGRGQGARHSGIRTGGDHRVGTPTHGPYRGRYSDGVEIYNFGFPVGPLQPRFRSRASYHIVPRDPVTSKSPQTLVPVNRYAADYQIHAERLFRDGQLDDALRAVQHAIIEDPTNGKLFLFQAQVLLALEDYSTASNLLRYATKSLEAKDWGYVIENRDRFYKPNVFSHQIGKLAGQVQKTPEDGPSQFLLGYQYLYANRGEQASAYLSKAVELDAHRELAERLLLLAGMSANSESESIPIPPPPAPVR